MILELFPNEKQIYFTLIKLKLIEEKEDAFLEIFHRSCYQHPEKFQIFDCYTCDKPICKICWDSNHKDHDVKEKYYYLSHYNSFVKKIVKGTALPTDQLKLNFKNIGFSLSRLLYDVSDYNKYIINHMSLFEIYPVSTYKPLKNKIRNEINDYNDHIFLCLDKQLKGIFQEKEKLKESEFIEIKSGIEDSIMNAKQVYYNLASFIYRKLTECEEIKKKGC